MGEGAHLLDRAVYGIGQANRGLGLLDQSIPTTPGETVTLSGWINVTSYVSGIVNLDLLASGLDTGGIALSATTSGFEFFEEEIIIPSGVTSVSLRAFCDSTPEMTCYFDDIKLTKNSETPFLTEIQIADVPLAQEGEFKRLILKYKPIHSWAALIINFT